MDTKEELEVAKQNAKKLELNSKMIIELVINNLIITNKNKLINKSD